MAKSKYAQMMADEEAAAFGDNGLPTDAAMGVDAEEAPVGDSDEELGKLTDDVNAVLNEDEAGGDKAAILAKDLKVDKAMAEAMVREAEARPELADLDGKALAARLKSDYSLRMSVEEAIAENEEPPSVSEEMNPFAKE